MSWSPMTSLPGVRDGVRGITIGTQVLMMGNIRLVHTVITSSLQYSGGWDGSSRDEIYSLDLNTEEWKLVDHLNVARGHHAVSVVSEDYWNFCNSSIN